MEYKNIRKSELQLNYFSANYLRFENDFYAYSSFSMPLTFIIDDLLLSMAESQQNYFILPAKYSRDRRDHYFYFTVSSHNNNKFIRIYEYDYML